jgi:hypothetical protein
MKVLLKRGRPKKTNKMCSSESGSSESEDSEAPETKAAQELVYLKLRCNKLADEVKKVHHTMKRVKEKNSKLEKKFTQISQGNNLFICYLLLCCYLAG